MPVFDQYEIEPAVSFSGSYTDNIIDIFSGSFFGNDKKFIGSKLAELNENNFPFEMLYSDFVYYVSGAAKGRNTNFVTLPSTDEIFFDSLVPAPVDIHEANGIDFVLNGNEVSGSSILGISAIAASSSMTINIGTMLENDDDDFITSGSDDRPVRDLQWRNNFPFQGKYSSLTRLLKPSTVLSKEYLVRFMSPRGNAFEDGGHDPVLDTPVKTNLFNTKIFAREYVINTFTAGPRDVYPVEGTKTETLPLGPTNDKDLLPLSLENSYKFYFGIGRRFDTYRENDFGPAYALRHNYPHSLEYGEYGYQLISLIVAGWKYGIYNALPTKSNVIFRRGKFGQFRDMLEQRPYTRFRLATNDTITSSPVTVTFLSGTDASVTASNSLSLNPRDSGIYDIHCASGQPFSDAGDS